MSEVWRCSWHNRDNKGDELCEDHDTEKQAERHRRRLALMGVVAYVYPIQGEESA